MIFIDFEEDTVSYQGEAKKKMDAIGHLLDLVFFSHKSIVLETKPRTQNKNQKHTTAGIR